MKKNKNDSIFYMNKYLEVLGEINNNNNNTNTELGNRFNEPFQRRNIKKKLFKFEAFRPKKT